MKLNELSQKISASTSQLSGLARPYLQELAALFSHAKKKEAAVLPASKLACDFGQSKIVFLEMQNLPEGMTILKWEKIARPKEPVKATEAVKQCFENTHFESRKVRISVKGQGVIVRFIQFPKMKPADLKSAIAFEAEKYIPFKANEVVVDFHILEEEVSTPSGPMMNLLLVAVKRDEIYTTIQIFTAAGLQVELIDIDALTFLNALEFCHPDMMKAAVGILDIGTEISTLTIMREGKPRFIRDISYGGADIIKRLKRKLGLSDEDALKQLLIDKAPSPEALEVLKEGLGNLVTDLKVSLEYYLDQVQPSEPLARLFLGGGGGYHPIVVETLSKDLGFPVLTLDILSKIKLGAGVDPELVKKNQGLLPVALGLCIRDL